jgi:S1-C subfamily serine protease
MSDLTKSQGVLDDAGMKESELRLFRYRGHGNPGPLRAETVDGQRVPVGGDVIVGIDGQPIASHHDLARQLLLETQPGQEIQVTVLRDGERVTETLTLERRPDPQAEGDV